MVWVYPKTSKTISSTIGALRGAGSFKAIFTIPTYTIIIIPNKIKNRNQPLNVIEANTYTNRRRVKYY
jgi:hypothetical protein